MSTPANSGNRQLAPLHTLRPTLLFSLLVAVGSAAADTGDEDAQIRFRLIDGKPVARCIVQCGDRSIPANVVFDLGSRAPLLMHERTARLLKVDAENGASLRFSAVTLQNLRTIAVELASLEELTVRFASDLGELPAVAVVGLPAFENQSVRLSVNQGTLQLLPPSILSPDAETSATTLPPPEDAITVPYRVQGHGYWLAGVIPDDMGGFEVRARFGTARYDTYIDGTVADLADAPGGNVEGLRIGSLDITDYVALRPVDLTETPEPHPDVQIGVNLLEYFSLTIDPRNQLMQFEPTRSPDFPEHEQEYFIAEVAQDADAIEAFLEAHPKSRLATDAAVTLLNLRLDAYPPDKSAIQRAVRHRADTVPPERRSQRLVELADALLESDREERFALAEYTLNVGLEYAPLDLNAQAAHQIHARLGYLSLRQDELKEARRHLLSAAFGMPKDPQVNLWMGELYERMGKKARAWSRYAQANLADEAPVEALKGLDRLNRDPSFRAEFTMTDAEQLLEGRMLEFHPPGRFVSDRDAAAEGSGAQPTPVALVELFSSVDHGTTAAAELAFQGLQDYFEQIGVAFVEYHIPSPEADPLTTGISRARAGFYKIDAAPVALFDGDEQVIGGGADDEVDKVYDIYRKFAVPSEPRNRVHRVHGRVSVRNGEISGRIGVAGAAVPASARLLAILCEQAVMAPGANGVTLHRQVARAAISPPAGWPVEGDTPFSQAFTVPVEDVMSAVKKGIEAVEQENDIQFFVRPTYVDVDACNVVAILQDTETKRVYSAATLPVVRDEQESK